VRVSAFKHEQRVGEERLMEFILKRDNGDFREPEPILILFHFPFVQMFVAQFFKYLHISSTSPLYLMLSVYERWMKVCELCVSIVHVYLL